MTKMIQKVWDERQDELKAALGEMTNNDLELMDYKELLGFTLSILFGPDAEYSEPDAAKIHEIDDGDYQGTLLFLVPEGGYQPSTYWVFIVSYGSCSGCDALLSIKPREDFEDSEWGSKHPDEPTVEAYWNLCLHMIQSSSCLSKWEYNRDPQVGEPS